MKKFIEKTEAEAKGYVQKMGVDVILENKNMIINPSNYYWVDNHNIIQGRIYYNENDLIC